LRRFLGVIAFLKWCRAAPRRRRVARLLGRSGASRSPVLGGWMACQFRSRPTRSSCMREDHFDPISRARCANFAQTQFRDEIDCVASRCHGRAQRRFATASRKRARCRAGHASLDGLLFSFHVCSRFEFQNSRELSAHDRERLLIESRRSARSDVKPAPAAKIRNQPDWRPHAGQVIALCVSVCAFRASRAREATRRPEDRAEIQREGGYSSRRR